MPEPPRPPKPPPPAPETLQGIGAGIHAIQLQQTRDSRKLDELGQNVADINATVTVHGREIRQLREAVDEHHERLVDLERLPRARPHPSLVDKYDPVSERAFVGARAEATRRTARSPRRGTLNSAAVTGSYGRVRAEAVSIPCGQRGESSRGGARLRSPPRPAAAHPQAQNGLLCGQVSVEMQERQGSAGGVKWIRKI